MRVFLFSLFCFFPLFASAHVVIQMNEMGFHPSEITVDQGETVIFQNIGKEAHWPASNIHPSHQIYPEFDPKQGVNPGDGWEFQFDRAGEWRMHDHLFPNFGGEIRVQSTKGYSSYTQKTGLAARALGFSAHLFALVQRFYYRIFPAALEKKLGVTDIHSVARNDSLLRYWITLTGPERLIQKLVAETGGSLFNDCHYEAHQVGRVSFELLGGAAFSLKDTSCASGFYHGVIEAVIRESGAEHLAEYVDTVCTDFKTALGSRECFHGIGHGLMAYESYELPASLADCQKITYNVGRGFCYDGAFMENYLAAQEPDPSIGYVTKWANDDLHFPCNALPADPQLNVSCYLAQTSLMLHLTEGDFARVAKECARAPLPYASFCFLGFGRDVADITLGNPKKMKALCDLTPHDRTYHKMCIEGAIGAVADFWAESFKDQSVALCKILPENDKGNCYAYTLVRLRDTLSDPSAQNAACAAFEPAYRSLCSTL